MLTQAEAWVLRTYQQAELDSQGMNKPFRDCASIEEEYETQPFRKPGKNQAPPFHHLRDDVLCSRGLLGVVKVARGDDAKKSGYSTQVRITVIGEKELAEHDEHAKAKKATA